MISFCRLGDGIQLFEGQAIVKMATFIKKVLPHVVVAQIIQLLGLEGEVIQGVKKLVGITSSIFFPTISRLHCS